MPWKLRTGESLAVTGKEDGEEVWAQIRLYFMRKAAWLAHRYSLTTHDVEIFYYFRFRYAFERYDPARGASLKTLMLKFDKQKLMEWHRHNSEALTRRWHKLSAKSESLEEWELEDTSDPFMGVDNQDLFESVRAQLTELQQKILHLVYEEGLSVNRCCYILHISPELAYREHARLLDKARLILDESHLCGLSHYQRTKRVACT